MIIFLPWPSTKLSPNARVHWAVLNAEKRRYKQACYILAKNALKDVGRPKSEKLHLDIEFFPPSRREYDLDNALARLKAGLDGIAYAIGVDDKHWSISIKKSSEIGGYVKVGISEIETMQ